MLYVNFKDVGARNNAPAKIGREKDRQNLNAIQGTSVRQKLVFRSTLMYMLLQ